MKKRYINPEMEVVKLETQQIIAASVGLSTDEVNGGLSRELDLDVDLEDQNTLINQLLGM
ncbi:MAG: hypothetical protein J6M15_11095 [Prevotella sp.]|nr:hypothetical protein [Prevotella sp.]